MNLLKRMFVTCGFSALTAAGLAAGPVQAQDYPTRNITMIVPFVAGFGRSRLRLGEQGDRRGRKGEGDDSGLGQAVHLRSPFWTGRRRTPWVG